MTEPVYIERNDGRDWHGRYVQPDDWEAKSARALALLAQGHTVREAALKSGVSVAFAGRLRAARWRGRPVPAEEQAAAREAERVLRAADGIPPKGG